MLEWLVANKSTGDEEDVIEDVTAKTLNTLIGNIDNLVVLFCSHFLFFSASPRIIILVPYLRPSSRNAPSCLQTITVTRSLCRR